MYKIYIIIGLCVYSLIFGSCNPKNNRYPFQEPKIADTQTPKYEQLVLNALRSHPNDLMVNLKAIDLFIQKQQWKVADSIGTLALAFHPSDCRLLLVSAQIKQKQNQIDQAISLATKAHKHNCNLLPINLLLSDMWITKGKYSTAIFYLNEMVAKIPDLNESHYLKGLIALGESDSTKALKYLETYLSRGGSNPQAFSIFTQCLYIKKDYVKILDIFKKNSALRSVPYNQLLLSRLFKKVSKFDSSAYYLQLSLADSTLWEAYHEAGEIAYENKEYLVAAKYWVHEKKVNPAFKNDHALAMAYWKSNQLDLAKELYQNILDTDSLDSQAAFALDKIRKQSLAQYSRKIQNNTQDSNRVLVPEAPSYSDTILPEAP